MGKEYYPVPFHFVPFSNKKPKLFTTGGWEGKGRLLSGCIEYSMTVLTDLHVVGKAVRFNDEYKNGKSYFARMAGKPVISGSTIKGVIRAFFEAVTNSWISHANDEYPSKHKERYWGFSAYNTRDKCKEKDKISFGPVIPEDFHPPKFDSKVQSGEIKNSEIEIDAASFLFGNILGEGKDAQAYPGRLIFEDIAVSKDLLMVDEIILPDVKADAFMGGPKPRINNWWYFEPLGIAERKSGRFTTAQFIGDKYRGRKFYFHQYPDRAVNWYRNSENWPQTKLCEYMVETLSVGSQLSGRVYFERVPEPFLQLLLASLQPTGAIRHKIGYGKAFGLGSVQTAIDRVTACESDSVFAEPQTYDFMSIFAEGGLASKDSDYSDYVDSQALKWLTRILSFDDLLKRPDCIFVYPPFAKGYFQTPVQIEKVRRIQRENKNYTAETIAESLFDHKRTIDFRLYQKNSLIWNEIRNRA